jgi:hypothetical protein
VVCFFEFLTLFSLGGNNFLKSILFWMIFSAPKAPIGGLQVMFKNDGAFSLDLACLECLSVVVVIQLQFNLQLKNN